MYDIFVDNLQADMRFRIWPQTLNRKAAYGKKRVFQIRNSRRSQHNGSG